VTQSFDKELYTKRVSVKNLKVGDILAHDIYLRQGTLVIKAGVEITEKHLESLRKMGDRVVTLDQRKLYVRGITASKSLMKKAAENKVIPKQEVNDLMQPFIEEVKREKNIFSLLEQLQTKDEYTFQHTINIGVLSYIFGDWYGLKGEDLHQLVIAGTLHDIGKSKIPLEILNKPGPLTDEEYEIMKQHTVYGYEVLQRGGGYEKDVMLAVLQHHERENGDGYPLGLKGNQIHLFAKIVAVADVYHAMTSDRVYRRKVNPYTVLEHLKKNIYDLDVKIIQVVINKMLAYLQGCRVVLNNGIRGDVVYIDKEDLARPLVKVSNETLIDLKEHPGLKIVEVVYDR